MATDWGTMLHNTASRVGRNLNPVNAARNLWDRATTHPIQTGISTLLGLVNPALGAVARTGFNRHNTNQFNDSAAQLLSDSGDRLNNQIWGNQGAAPTQGMGAGMQGGMQGITSPMGNYGSHQQSSLAQMLGLNNYQGNSSGNGLPGITSPVPAGQGPSQGQPAMLGTTQSQPPTSHNITGAATGAHGYNGMTAGTATLGQVESMLNAGLGSGQRPLMSPHEINDERAQARAAGMSLAQYRATLGV